MRSINRRSFLKTAGTAAYALALFEGFAKKANAQSTSLPVADKLLFVISAGGGASIVDSFMAVKQSECPDASRFICYPDAFVTTDAATGLRALDLPQDHRNFLGGIGTGTPYTQSTFLNRFKDDLAVMTLEGTSVNHLVAQKRSMNGFGIHRDRSLLELIAERHGQSLLLPNINMTAGGYLEESGDPTLPEKARQEVVADARFFSLSTDGLRGMIGAPGSDVGAAPVGDAALSRARDLMSRARNVRDALDDASTFGKTFQCSPLRRKLLARRSGLNIDMEAQSLITNLTLLAENDLPELVGPQFPPLSFYGLEPAPETEDVRRAFDPVGVPGLTPGTRIFVDQLLAQAVLAFLLARFGLTCGTAFGPNLTADINVIDVNPPLAFDFSHTSHVAAQSTMWSRILDVTDKLVTLLKATDCGDGSGETMWDRSTIYIATEFGRDKVRNFAGQALDATAQISTGHNLNNGHVILSPRLNPGVYGGVDPATLQTFGVNRATGVATQGELNREGDIYSAVSQCIDAPFPGRIEMPWLVPA
jgi:hypothetical protein